MIYESVVSFYQYSQPPRNRHGGIRTLTPKHGGLSSACLPVPPHGVACPTQDSGARVRTWILLVQSQTGCQFPHSRKTINFDEDSGTRTRNRHIESVVASPICLCPRIAGQGLADGNSEIRTHTERVLSALPLPVGLRSLYELVCRCKRMELNHHCQSPPDCASACWATLADHRSCSRQEARKAALALPIGLRERKERPRCDSNARVLVLQTSA